jgi:DNA-binding protein H-NS
MARLESIQAKIAKLQAEADAIVNKQSANVIAEIHSLMSEYGITMDDLGSALGGKKRGRKPGAKFAGAKASSSTAKYMDPKSGATWSGHGRAPGWIANAKNREKFLIEGSTVDVSTAAKKSPKAIGNYVRGPQPPLYRDPKSGAEWSGRGRAPAWIASAKNRERFLIDGSATTAPAVDKSSAKPVGNYPRGPQPAKYRDPKSGAEWSGRGKAPGWLASAKDRTKFLIGGAASTAPDGNESTPKVVAAKKVSAKKTKAIASGKKPAAKKASATSATVSGSKKASAKKSISAAKKAPQAGSKAAASKTAAAKKSRGDVTADNAADFETLPMANLSDAEAVISAA